MANALFAFENCEAGQRAAQRLIDEGLPAEAVQVHARPGGGKDTLPRQADEQITGGLLTNVFDLFKGVFEWGGSPHDASAFEETVRRGGAVVSVDAKTEEQCDAVDEIMLAASCDRHTGWSNPPGG
jgi:hypothetical protein